MSIRGWVYVITNKAMPGLVKIGYSTKDPNLRARELGGTGVPHPFIVDADFLCFNPREVEQRVHSKLFDRREGKEWFRCDPSEAKSSINDVLKEFNGSVPAAPAEGNYNSVDLNSKYNVDFVKLMKPSAILAAVIGVNPMPRVEVTKKIWEYIAKNNLQDATDKRMINADAKLKEIFKKPKVSMFELTKLINDHLS